MAKKEKQEKIVAANNSVSVKDSVKTKLITIMALLVASYCILWDIMQIAILNFVKIIKVK